MASQPWTKADVERINKRKKQPWHEVVAALPASLTTASKRSKWGNTKTPVTFGEHGEIVKGVLAFAWTFDSAEEAKFYRECVLRRAAGELRDLRLQEPYALIARGFEGAPGGIVGHYYADAVFFDVREHRQRVCDVKSAATKQERTYRLKKKLLEINYGITLEEIG